MPTVHGSIDVTAPVDRVYGFVADHPEGATSFIPGLNRITNVAPVEAGVGQSWEYEFNWFGLVISGKSHCTTFERPRVYQFRTETGARSTWTYRFDPIDNGTRLTLEVEYDVPQNQLVRFASEAALEKMNKERGAETLTNLKGLIEE